MGGEFTKKTISELDCKIVIGGANNQLLNAKLAQDLQNKGVWYIPDYVVNSGGLIQIVDELDKTGYNTQRVVKRVTQIGNTVKELIIESKRSKKTPLLIAENIANKKLYHDKRKK